VYLAGLLQGKMLLRAFRLVTAFNDWR